ncbi:MAG TPA: hypothetical protein VHA76_06895 [Solirubrobacterales bacterium]|nr:hypothetical protein [Solirubrobacterales bacterium]
MSRLPGAALLPIALGLADGILNALTLAAANLVGSGGHIDVGLALRISAAALVTAGFAVFVAEYSDARGALRRASRQLNMSNERGLVETQLGRSALRSAVMQSAIAAAASMFGALAPLLLAAALPGPGWIAAVVAIVALGFLGAGLATAVLGNRLIWAAALVLGGILVTALGAWLKIA